jgi:hypothetical protein
MARTWNEYFDHYLDGRKSSPPRASAKADSAEWVARNATAEIRDGVLHVAPDNGKQRPFLAFTKFQIPGPAIATAVIRTMRGGKLGLSWRLEGQKDFPPAQSVLQEVGASVDFQEVTLQVPAEGSMIHIRLHLPDGPTDLRRVTLQAAKGKPAKQWSFNSQP